MKVILLQDVKNVGKKGTVTEVSDGYATNFLLKKGLAVMQNKESLNALNKEKEAAKTMDLMRREAAAQTKEKLKGVALKFKCNAGKEGKLHKAITAKMVEEELLNQFGLTVDKKNFKNFSPIKALGEVTLEVNLYKDISGKINIEVIESDEKN